ncbi:S8 family serine peptidase [Halopiger xanaduensis]|uniref:Peptidase S8 and S53 subtilisin kexin sedolisin n=1 Tax=Halopiger xanaduensis (strain DSM 18323 / JCM 14033 / SH-6) TaxID=797210 RepID=F8DAS6_HALXS|nr:S8 family serine peptidase [Halopiger xanaduensis]AEH37018.1 peptidase S8 and S53 subtilisin kexin sedolisin [Halopiger xanaduensis SH-6]
MSASTIGSRARSAGVAALVACLLCVLFIGAAPGAWAATPAASAPDDATPASAEPAPVADALENADGTVTTLIRLEPFDGEAVSSVDEGVDEIEVEGEREDDIIAARRSHAEATQQSLERYANATEGVTLERSFWITNAAQVTVDTERASLADLAQLEGVTRIERDAVVSSSSVAAPSAPSTGEATATRAELATAGESSSAEYTEGLEKIRVPEAWDAFRTRGEGVRVAVLDSGVDADHPDIEVAEWKDFDDNPSAEPVDYDGHGTQVSGIVAGGNASGTHIGVAPDATLLHGAVMTDCENRKRCGGRSSTILAGMEWALEEDADVISLSLGWDGHSRASVDAIENAREAGTVVVGAVGNGGEGTSLSPGNAYDVVSVGAIDRSDDVPSFSGGEEIDTAGEWRGDAPVRWPDSYVVPDVVAPGVSVKSATPGGGYRTNLGTSLTAPHVAGTVALVQSATAEELSPDEIKRALEETAWKPEGEDVPAAKDVRYGSGIVDAYAAIDAVGQYATLAGTVTDAETGAPIANATVEVIGEGDPYEATTDADGRYEIPGLAGDQEYAVVVERDGYESVTETRTVASDETSTLDVELAGNGTIEVDVTDAHFGDGIEAATVEAVGPAGTYTGAHVGDGTYRLENVPTRGEYDLRVGADGYVDAERAVSFAADTDRLAESVTLDGDAALAVTVQTEDREPIENATVTVERDSGVTYDANGTTREDGTLEVVVPGTGESYAVEAAAPEFESNAVETGPVASGETVSVTVPLPAPVPFPVTGTVAALFALCAVLGGVYAWQRARES